MITLGRLPLVILALCIFFGLFDCAKKNPFGQLTLRVKGKNQHVFLSGEGSPIVVFITGAGSNLEDFDPVQKEISKATRTFSYDKAGIGKSEMIDGPRTIENMTSELLSLLEQTGIENDILLVGHSLGGFVARDFLAKYPEKVIGMVLIDPGNEYFTERVLLTFPEEKRSHLDSLIHTPNPNSPIGFQAEIESRRSWDVYMRNNKVSSSVPIVLIESAHIDESNLLTKEVVGIKQNLNKDFQRQMSDLKIITTEKSGHFIQLDEPELVIKTILDILMKL